MLVGRLVWRLRRGLCGTCVGLVWDLCGACAALAQGLVWGSLYCEVGLSEEENVHCLRVWTGQGWMRMTLLRHKRASCAVGAALIHACAATVSQIFQCLILHISSHGACVLLPTPTAVSLLPSTGKWLKGASQPCSRDHTFVHTRRGPALGAPHLCGRHSRRPCTRGRISRRAGRPCSRRRRNSRTGSGEAAAAAAAAAGCGACRRPD